MLVVLIIMNCYNTGDVSGSYYYVGGIVGYVHETATIANCYNTGSVSSDYYNSGVGGIVGAGGGTISDCYNEGILSGRSIGGIVGCVFRSTTITNCYNTVNIISNNDGGVGGICGRLNGTVTITNCYNTGDVSGSYYYVGGIVGYVQLVVLVIILVE